MFDFNDDRTDYDALLYDDQDQPTAVIDAFGQLIEDDDERLSDDEY